MHEDGTEFAGQDHPVTAALRTGELTTGIMGVHKPDGTLAWISIAAQPVQQPEVTTHHGVVVTFFDITAQRAIEAERVRLTDELADRLRLRTALLTVAEEIAVKDDQQQLLETLATQAVQIAGAEHCGFYSWNATSKTVTTIWSTSPSEPVGTTQADDIAYGAMLAGGGGNSRDANHHKFDQQTHAGGRQRIKRSSAALPLVYKGRLLGIFVVWTSQPDIVFDTNVIESPYRLDYGIGHVRRHRADQLARGDGRPRPAHGVVTISRAVRPGSLEIGIDIKRLSPAERAAITEANAHLDAAASKIVQLQVGHFETVLPPLGTALDIEASSHHP